MFSLKSMTKLEDLTGDKLHKPYYYIQTREEREKKCTCYTSQQCLIKLLFLISVPFYRFPQNV
jgi:hypothetical protein